MRLIRKTRRVQRAVKPIAAAIAGKHSARPIPAMGGRRKTNDQKTRLGVTEAGQRFSPIFQSLITSWRFFRDGLTPADQTWTLFAANDAFIESVDGSHPCSVTTMGDKKVNRGQQGASRVGSDDMQRVDPYFQTAIFFPLFCSMFLG